ncbi:glycosyltransferase [Paracoccus methylarcula]|uniref:glycosyltransferase n=1 Tax=Paracoccus methylarcula TaxID=72022 RepID=UPI001B87F81E|nr:glycosyltransferase [Paracoccus methylarcula]
MINKDADDIRKSGLFDRDWYLSTYPDVAMSGMPPLAHFLQIGARLKRDPGPDFDTAGYLEEYRDIEKAGINPLLHYIQHGRDEGRQARPNSGQPASRSEIGARIAGDLRRRPGRTTVLLCAHSARQQLFGGERSFLDMVDGISALDFNLIITIPSVENQAYLAALKQRSVAIYHLPIPWWRGDIPVAPATIGRIASIIAAEHVDVVHSNTIMLREPLLAARYMGVRSLVQARELIQHDEHLLEEIRLTAPEIIEWLWENADGIIANSHVTATGFTLPGKSPHVVYNTVDMSALRKMPPPGNAGPLRVGLISSNLPKKGLGAFTKIAQKLEHTHPDIHFHIIGPDTSLTEDIRERLSRKELPESIKLLGYRDTPAAAIAETDVVLSISTFQESFGRTVLESMAGARPVIVYDHGAPPELVTTGRSGFVVPFGDVSKIADLLGKLSKDRNLLIQMGRNARDEAHERFGRDVYIESLRSAYTDLLDRESSPPRVVLPARSDLSPLPRTALRIAYFLWHFPVPSETFVLNELRILKANGVDVRVFCRHSPHEDFTPDFEIEWETVDSPEHLANRLQATGRTVVHSHFVFPTVTEMVWPACEKARVPFTFIAHAQDIFRYRNDLKNRIGEVARSPWCRKVFVPSSFHERYLSLRGVPENKMVPSANGCDDTLYAAARMTERSKRPFRRIIAIHRFAEKKGLGNLVRAAKLLEPDGIRVALYGYGDLEAEYRRIVADKGIGNVEFCGAVNGLDEMLDAFRSCDLFSCPSVRAADGDMDGIPTVVMEAMSAGVPVITTAISGIPDLVEDGLTGMLSEATPEAIAERVRAYYALPDAAVEAMIENGLERIQSKYNSERLVEGMMRIWANETVDLMIVSWNNLPELYEVTQRLLANTSMPHHLIICDNGSRPSTLAYLVDLQGRHDNITLIINRENAYVGPGTNICLQHGRSDYAVYVCGKEGMTTAKGWEIPLIHYMNANPRVGQAGTLCYSPSYLHGRDYPKGVALFDKFRNQDFARNNPDRSFCHVQGGFFVLRREMIDEIGGFSNDVAHAYTDVEFSYYVESRGWELGQAPGMLSLYNKTRPSIFHRLDEKMSALHPPTLNDLPILDAVSKRSLALCNACGKSSPAFTHVGAEAVCPECGSTRRSRSLQRFLSESLLLYRRLPALAVSAPGPLLDFWRHQFQGHALSLEDLLQRLAASQPLNIAENSLPLILLNDIWLPDMRESGVQAVLNWTSRLLKEDGMMILSGPAQTAELSAFAQQCGLEIFDRKRFASAVSHFDWQPLYLLRHTSVSSPDKHSHGDKKALIQ